MTPQCRLPCDHLKGIKTLDAYALRVAISASPWQDVHREFHIRFLIRHLLRHQLRHDHPQISHHSWLAMPPSRAQQTTPPQSKPTWTNRQTWTKPNKKVGKTHHRPPARHWRKAFPHWRGSPCSEPAAASFQQSCESATFRDFDD